MKFATEKERPLIPAGEHILRLTSVTEKEMDDRYGRSATGKTTRILWDFASNETDDDGVPYTYAVFTGPIYGNAKAGMTLLIDMLVPGMTVEAFDDFDTDDLIGKRFRSQIKHVKKDDGAGMKATHVYITPVQNKAKPVQDKPAAVETLAADAGDDDDLRDPFEDN